MEKNPRDLPAPLTITTKQIPDGEFVFTTEFREVEVDLDEARQMVGDAVGTLEGEKPDHDPDCDFCSWKEAVH